MLEGGRVADVILDLSTEHDPTIENNSAIPPQGPVMDRDPTLVVGTVATNTSMVVSSIHDNVERGEHHSDSGTLENPKNQKFQKSISVSRKRT
jgi:hypothetical protein